jgi:hypothetical protein
LKLRRVSAKPASERRPHAFFWLYLAILVVGIVAACLAPGSAPAWALGSGFIHRCEIGVAVGGLVYLVSIGAWLAWNGQYLGQLQLPGGLGGGGGDPQPIDAAATQVEGAATEFDEYRKEADKRFKGIENALDNVVNRIKTLEADKTDTTIRRGADPGDE